MEYFKNFVHRNIHVYSHNLCNDNCTSNKDEYIVAFQTNWTNHWYYLNDKGTIGEMRYATNAKRFTTEVEAKEYMESVFKNLESQGEDLLKI